MSTTYRVPTKPNPRQCLTCVYWQPDPGYLDVGLQPRPAGHCHRYPADVEGAGWPITYPDDWCGEWAETFPYLRPARSRSEP